jgi:serine/threonine protein kinase/Flp pilus assembly protein TadD
MTHAYRDGEEPISGAGYRLVRFLGRGGFGEVWKATAPGGAEVALKIIRLGGAEGRKEFRALQLVKRIRHPNLMPLSAFWLKSDDGSVLNEALATQQDPSRAETGRESLSQTMVVPADSAHPPAAELIIAMGLGDQSLFDRLEECRTAGGQGIPRQELLRYMQDAARAIDFLNRAIHEQDSGLVAIQHCDIKPHNLMIVGGAVQVCDFGLARMLGADKATTAAASLAYAAPECLETGNPSASTDQYSLAISYYELATGLLPFADPSVAAVIDAKRRGALNFSAVSAQEQAVLRRAASPDPQRRYSSAWEMVDALVQATPGGSNPSGDSPAHGGRRRWPAAVGILAAAVLVLSAAVVWPPWDRLRMAPKPPVASSSGNADTAAAGRKQLVDGRAASTALAPARAADATPHQQAAQAASALAIERAAAAEARGQWQSAIDQYSAALVQWPSPAAHLGRGRCYLNLAQYQRAIDDLTQVKTESPQAAAAALAAAYLGSGTAYLDQGNYDPAIAQLSQAASLDSADARIYSRRGVAWFHKNDFQKAVDDFSTAIRIAPDGKDYVNRGQARRKLGDLKRAIADFVAATQQNPHGAAAYYQLADCYEEEKRYDQAVAAITEAIKNAAHQADPGFALADAYFVRGSYELENERPQPAIDDFNEALRRGFKDEASLQELRAAAYELKKHAGPARTEH